MPQSILKWLYRMVLRFTVRPFIGPPFPFAFQRRYVATMTRTVPGPRGVVSESVSKDPVPLTRVAAGRDDPKARPALLWVHGGGFVLGSAKTHAPLGGFLATSAGADVYLPDYRLAPEHPFPAATDDVFRAYEQVLSRGHDPARVAIGGDSAGGAIALLAALEIQDMELASPAALVLASPVTDLTLSGPSIEERRRREALLRRGWLYEGYRAFAGSRSLSDPQVSPLYADLGGLPPTLIQVGEEEILLDDSLRLADRAWAAGVEVELQRYPGMWHDFQLHAAFIDDAAEANEQIGAFLRRRWS
ncbi:MAG TPA: alpha/beta hydrolase [Solirubrobacterales bacterium]|nr:alpha/beta hydrolase [Solirubrobacterales bacterium]